METGLMVAIGITSAILPGMYFYFIIAILILSAKRKTTQSKPNVMMPDSHIYYPYKKSKAIKVMVVIMVCSFFCIVIPEIILIAVYAETGEMLWWGAALAFVLGLGITILVGRCSFGPSVTCIELNANTLTVKHRKGEDEVYPVPSYQNHTMEAKSQSAILKFGSPNGVKLLYLNMLTPNASDILIRSLAFAKKNKRMPVVEVLPPDSVAFANNRAKSPAFVNGQASPVPSQAQAFSSEALPNGASSYPSQKMTPAAQAGLLKTNQELAEIEADPVKYNQYLRSFLALLSVQARSRISTLCAQDQKMQAIKECREITGAGLKYAKETVEKYLAVPSLNFYSKRIYLENTSMPQVKRAMEEYDELYTDEVPFVVEYGEAVGTTWTFLVFRAKPKCDENVLWWEFLNVLLWLTETTHTLFAFAQPAASEDPLTRVAADASLSAANGINLRKLPHPKRSLIFLEPELDNASGDTCKGILHGYRFRFHVPERKIEWISEESSDFDYVRHIRDLFSFDPTDIREKIYHDEEIKAEVKLERKMEPKGDRTVDVSRELGKIASESENSAFATEVSYKSYSEPAASAYFTAPAAAAKMEAQEDTVTPEARPSAAPASEVPETMDPAGGEWKFVTSGVEGNADVFGVNIFDYKWENTGKTAVVKDPSYNQEFRFTVYRVEIKGVVHEFAAGEMSPLVYGFFTRE